VHEAAASMVGLHPSDPATIYLSSWTRVGGSAHEHLEGALRERRRQGQGHHARLDPAGPAARRDSL